MKFSSLLYFLFFLSITYAQNQHFRVIPSEGMAPTINAGDYVWAEPDLDYAVGDVVLFKYPLNPNIIYVKRIVAKGIGQFIEGKNFKIVVNGKTIEEEERQDFDPKRLISQKLRRSDIKLLKTKTGEKEHYILHDFSINTNKNFKKTVLPSGTYFLIGDNRDFSIDSRVWGGVHQKDILSKVKYVYYKNRDNSKLVSSCMVDSDSSACNFLALILIKKKQYVDAHAYARKSCELEDNNGCLSYAATLRILGKRWEAINTLNILCQRKVIYACKTAVKLGSYLEVHEMPKEAFEDIIDKEFDTLFEED